MISLFAEEPMQSEAYDAHTSSPASFAMIGWRDTDGDGVLDVLDVPLTLTGAGAFSPSWPSGGKEGRRE